MADFNVKLFLDEMAKTAEMSAEDKAALDGLLTKSQKTIEYLKGAVLRQSDYSRQSDEARAEVEKVKTEAKAYVDSLTEWQKGEQSRYSAADAELEKLRQENTALQAAIKKAADEYSLEIDVPKPPAGVEPKPNGRIDTSKFLTQDDAAIWLQLTPHLLSLSARHRKLFGEDLDDPNLVSEAMVARQRDPNVTLEGYWKGKYKVENKVREIEEAKVQERIAREVNEKLNDALSKASLPGVTRPGVSGSPILSRLEPKRSSSLPPGVDAAVDAFNSGKYRTGT